MDKSAMVVKRHIGLGAARFNDSGMEFLGTFFSPKAVAHAIKAARPLFRELHIVRRKPTFAKDKFAYSVFGKRRGK